MPRKPKYRKPYPPEFRREAVALSARTVFDYIETFCNPLRLHSTLDYLSPANYERIRNGEKPRSSLTTRCPPKRGRSTTTMAWA
jgi:hypothetical protein